MVASHTVKLIQALEGDAAAIRKLTREAYAKWVPVIGREPKPMTADYAEAVKKHRFDFLYENGELAALIETVGCSDHLLIENVAVSPSFQGKGYGRMLMVHAEKLAASSNFEAVKLYTNKLFRRKRAALHPARIPRGPRGRSQRWHGGAHEQARARVTA